MRRVPPIRAITKTAIIEEMIMAITVPLSLLDDLLDGLLNGLLDSLFDGLLDVLLDCLHLL